MIKAFDRIVIEVDSLSPAVAEYTALLGDFETSGDTARRILGNVCIELRQGQVGAGARISELGLLDTGLAPGQEIALPGNNRGLSLSRSAIRNPDSTIAATPTGILAVDHLVLQSRDADACIALFGEEGLGMRLALDQQVPEWGGRMVFFRFGKMTLEVIQNLEQPVARDHFWGITYLCEDIDRTVAALDERGVAHSPVRTGRKPGTRVSTVKSHCLGLPTLLVGPE